MNPYDHIKTENYWQKKWVEDLTYKTDTHSSKPTFFGLVEFPYPSGAGLHVGHVRSYTGMDVIVRKRRMEGFETLFPIGWDAFGLPAENYAIKTGIHPSITTRENINTFREQLKACGFSFDWDREVDTTDPAYYKWTQWIFLKLYENGLAYKKEMPVNWCPKDKCVLANEEVVDGKCERCGAPAEKRNKEQWMLAITKYAERLDKDLDDTTFLERIKIQQRNWIGMSEGSELRFQLVPQKVADFTQNDAEKKTGSKKKVLIGTRNNAKFQMLTACFPKDLDIEFINLNDIDVDDSSLVEGQDFEENAKIKSEFYFKATGIPTISTDHILWLEKWPKDNGYMIHLRKEANPESERATDEEVVIFLKKWLEEIGGKTPAHFEYAVAFTDENGTKGFVSLQRNYILQPVQSEKFWPGYPTESLLLDVETNEYKGDQENSFRYAGLIKDLDRETRNWFTEKTRKPKVLVIHGFNAKSNGSWRPWLKTELEKNGYEVIIPDLPNAGHPKFEELMPFLSDITKSFTDEDVVIGHSMGGYLALKLAEKQTFKKVLLVAPCVGDVSLYDYEGWQKENPNDDYASLKKMIEENPVDFNLITTKDKRALFSENDPSIPFAVKNTLPKDWIIKTVESEGHFPEKEHPNIIEALDDSFTVYTTRADTLFGCTYCVLAPEHNLVKQLLASGQIKNKEEVEKYISEAIQKIDIDRSAEGKEKTGVLLEGVMAINPANKKEVPVFIADYVLATYGTGAIMAVPAHDERDGEFAKKYGIEVKEVIISDKSKKEKSVLCCEDGVLINSASFDGLSSEEARTKITEAVGGKLVKKSKLRDWVFARQRYWGEPIPLVYDKAGKMYPVAMSELPVTLPQVEKYEPTDNGESPLSQVKDWVYVKGKIDEAGYFHTDQSGEEFRRETDTMPQWAGSSWYFMRYIDPRNDTALGEKEMLMKWLPVTWYNGGMEHTTLHLLYSRFWYKFLFDIGLTPTSEPYMKRTSQGMILGIGGVKMSKSLGNVINPDVIVKKFGADTLRMYEMFIGPFDQAVAWDDKSVIGIRRFVDRLYTLRSKVSPSENSFSIIHKTIKKVGEDIDAMAFNTAISTLMICLNEFEKENSVPLEDFKSFLKLVAPFAPFITEELWKEIGEESSIHKESWPKYDETKLIDNDVTYVLQVNGKLRGEVVLPKDTSKEDVLNAVKSLEGYAKYVGEATPRQQIFVPGKLVNIVI